MPLNVFSTGNKGNLFQQAEGLAGCEAKSGLLEEDGKDEIDSEAIICKVFLMSSADRYYPFNMEISNGKLYFYKQTKTEQGVIE